MADPGWYEIVAEEGDEPDLCYLDDRGQVWSELDMVEGAQLGVGLVIGRARRRPDLDGTEVPQAWRTRFR